MWQWGGHIVLWHCFTEDKLHLSSSFSHLTSFLVKSYAEWKKVKGKLGEGSVSWPLLHFLTEIKKDTIVQWLRWNFEYLIITIKYLVFIFLKLSPPTFANYGRCNGSRVTHEMAVVSSGSWIMRVNDCVISVSVPRFSGDFVSGLHFKCHCWSKR